MCTVIDNKKGSFSGCIKCFKRTLNTVFIIRQCQYILSARFVKFHQHEIFHTLVYTNSTVNVIVRAIEGRLKRFCIIRFYCQVTCEIRSRDYHIESFKCGPLFFFLCLQEDIITVSSFVSGVFKQSKI